MGRWQSPCGKARQFQRVVCKSPATGAGKSHAGSRTLVTNFSGARRYRFSFTPGPQSRNAPLWQRRKPATTSLVALVLDGRGAAGHDLGPFRRHTCWPAGGALSRLLLPLRALAGFEQLHQNVRATEICCTLVGRFLQKAARTFSGRKSRRGSASASRRPRRARAALARPLRLWPAEDAHPGAAVDSLLLASPF